MNEGAGRVPDTTASPSQFENGLANGAAPGPANGAVAGGNGSGPGAEESEASFASGAKVLTIGIASTGIFTFAYLATASHVLDQKQYGRVSLCWAIMFVILSVIYRPVEQLLSRTIADRRARGLHHSLRVPGLIQVGFSLLFLVIALALRDPIENNLFGGESVLYWVLVIGVLAYAASYFARGWLAGHKRFALYGGLVFLESTSRFLFAAAAAVGIATGVAMVSLGMAVAPFVSLAVIPFAFLHVQRQKSGSAPRAHVPHTIDTSDFPAVDAAGEGPAHAGLEEASADLTLKHGTWFAVAVVGIMLAEQTLMNAAVLIVNGHSGAVLAGFVFNVLLIVRAPLQLFQAIQTSILPHLAGLEARESADEFHKAIRITILAIAAFAGAVAIGLLLVGPFVMTALLGNKGFHYARVGLAVVGLGMGLHLVSGTLNQAALARGRAPIASAAWLFAAALFVIIVATPTIDNEVTRVEVGYFISTLLLSLLLWAVYRRGPATDGATPPPGSPATAGAASS